MSELMNGAEQIAHVDKQLKTTAISSAEYRCGEKRNEKKTVCNVSEKFLRLFPGLSFYAKSASVYTYIAHNLPYASRHIFTFDELTAAIVLRNNEPPVSYIPHFAVNEGQNVIAS